jgi:2-oxoacid dehydrogenases acyltransferase (catalytic domain)
MPNIELTKKKDVSLFGKVAAGTWRTAYDPSVYGTIELRMDAAMDYIKRFRAAARKHLTVTHLLARAVGEVLKKMPDANSMLRYNRVYLRKNIGVFMQVVMTDAGRGARGAGRVRRSGSCERDQGGQRLNGLFVALMVPRW